MPNRLTRTPDRPVPPLPPVGRVLLPLADLVMILLASRPRSGSLATTWVTPATMGLCVVTTLGCILLAALLLHDAGGEHVLARQGALLLLGALALGSACIAGVGVAQRCGVA